MEKLGIQTNLLIAQLVNFAIIIFALNKLLYKPILDMLKKRKAQIEENIRISETLKVQEEKLGSLKKHVLDEAKKEAAVLLETMKKDAVKEKKVLMQDAQDEAEEIIKKAHAHAEQLVADAKTTMQKEAVTLATAMAKRLLVESLGEKGQRIILSRDIQQLKKQS